MALTDNLIGYWRLDEASGNAIDAHGANDLTDNNTVGAGTGKINGARDFEAGNTESFSIADNADLSTGDIDFTIAAWVQLESIGASRTIAAKREALGTREWTLEYDNVSLRFRFLTFNSSGTQVGEAKGDALGEPSTATWYYVVGWHDAAANTVNIQINDGTVDSAAESGVPSDTTALFRLGAVNTTPANLWDGLIDEVGFWKRVLTTQERTDLYNGGAGLSYDSFGGGDPEGSLIGGKLIRGGLLLHGVLGR